MGQGDETSAMEVDEKKSDVQEQIVPKFSINGFSLSLSLSLRPCSS